jgi:hypothetical protein
MGMTLEVLAAKHGDCLLLHDGSPDAELVLIDGGPAGVYQQSLRPRLQALHEARGGGPDDPLPIRLAMVSHIDDDHINGMLQLTGELCRLQDQRQPRPFEIEELWHNSFDDIVGNNAAALRTSAVAAVGAASLEGEIRDDLPVSRHGALVLASVGQGRNLRDDATKLGLALNASAGGGGLVTAPKGSSPTADIAGFTFHILAPSRQRLLDLQQEWDRKIEKMGLGKPAEAEAAALLDNSVYNLSSIVCLVEAGGRRLLLTGDARGDDILEGLANGGFLDRDGRIHLDLLKLPHHGSDRNVDAAFFEHVTADHYAVSGNGKYGNPEPGMFDMLLTARGTDAFALHLTYDPASFPADYPNAELAELLARHKDAGSGFELRPPDGSAGGATITL